MPTVISKRNECADSPFPFQGINDTSFKELFGECAYASRIAKCFSCKKRIKKDMPVARCTECNQCFHLKCGKITNNPSISLDWICSVCTLSALPFFSISNESMKLTTRGIKDDVINFLEDKAPSFSIQSLLDQIPGQKFETDQFMTNTIHSKYYTTNDFLSAKFSKNKFTVCHLNISSLQKHISELRTLLCCINHIFDIICVSETRLRTEVPLSNIQIDGYNFIHTPTHTQCGGAGMYIKNNIEFEIITNLTQSYSNVSESIFVELKHIKKRNVIVGSIYRHHTAVQLFIDTFFQKALQFITKTKKTCVLAGDFNVDLIKYGDNCKIDVFYDELSSHTFRPLILQPTRVTSKTRSLIDNIFTNDLSCLSSGGNLTTSISDHFCQFAQIDVFDREQEKKITKFGRNWRIFNKNEFAEELDKSSWDDVSSPHIDTNTSVVNFYSKIEKLLNEMAPVKKLSRKEIGLQQRPWITADILSAINEKNKLHKEFVEERNPTVRNEKHKQFKTKRNRVTSQLRKAKKAYYTQFFNENANNVKETWKGIRNLINVSKKSSTHINHLLDNGKNITDPVEMANTINKFYVNIGKSVEQKIPRKETQFSHYLNSKNNYNIVLHPCTEDEVRKYISTLPVSKASGPNSIPISILKTNIDQLVNPLISILNKSLAEGTFPDLLKSASVCPIYKKGDKSQCANYRPISLLSNLSKIFERTMYNRIEQFLSTFETIYKLQFGFRKRHSTEHALLNIIEKIRQNLDNGIFTCGVFIDLEKAFDTVNHEILLKKLDYYGIRESALKWIKSYLTNRKQFVSLNGVKSKTENISCGVPQGSILGPLLFIIYINDMHQAVTCSTVHHFADDTNILFSDKNPKSIAKILNKELAHIFEWLCANRLSLNVTKTEFIIFRPPKRKLSSRIFLRLNGTKIFESSKIKYLGVILDPFLRWNHHINELTKKLNRAIGMIFKIRTNCTKDILRSLYFSLFHSHLTYGLSVWGTSNNEYLSKLTLLQKKIVRSITFSDFYAHTSPLFKNLNILKLPDLYTYKIGSLMWDLDHNQLPDSLSTLFTRRDQIHKRNLRDKNKNKIYTAHRFNNSYGYNSFLYCGGILLNKLKDLSFYENCHSKFTFSRNYKQSIIDSY